MLDAICLTVVLLGGISAAVMLKADHDFNRDMQKILPRKERYSLWETPWVP